ncbi:NfeD family protein [Anaerotignum sp.]|uniref:NfeD family protein n=1 Tax=Anaerotignum sp. TaxID=2039241 RepID=UPI00332C5624
MLPWISVLAILGLVLVFAEMLIPGFGVFGILGIISLLCSTVLAAKMYGTIVFLFMLLSLIVLFFAMLLIAKKSGLYNKVILHDRQEAQDFDESQLAGLIGKIGITQSTLRPFGIAEIDDKSIDVCSLGDFIDRGKKVKVVQISGKTVTVKEWDEE